MAHWPRGEPLTGLRWVICGMSGQPRTRRRRLGSTRVPAGTATRWGAADRASVVICELVRATTDSPAEARERTRPIWDTGPWGTADRAWVVICEHVWAATDAPAEAREHTRPSRDSDPIGSS